MESDSSVPPKRGKGRPPGSRNKKTFVPLGSETVPQSRWDRIIDPHALIEEQLQLITFQQACLRNELTSGIGGGVPHSISEASTRKLQDLSNAIARTVETMKRLSDVVDELSKRLTAEQLLERAIKKIEGQDVSTINYAIRRLRAYRETIATVTKHDKAAMADSAASAITSLEDE